MNRLQSLMQHALDVLSACREVLALDGKPPSDLLDRLQTATDILHGMSEDETEQFSLASVNNFGYSIGGGYSSGHVAAWCLGLSVLSWIKGGRLDDQQRGVLGIMTTELGAQLQRERARIKEGEAPLLEQIVASLTPKQSLLFEFLWTRKTAGYNTLVHAVPNAWQDVPSDEAIERALKRMREKLEGFPVSLTIQVAKRRVVLDRLRDS